MAVDERGVSGNQRRLAEEIAGLEDPEAPALAPHLLDQPDRALLDQVRLRPRLSLAEDDLPLLEGAHRGGLGRGRLVVRLGRAVHRGAESTPSRSRFLASGARG